MFKTEHYHTDEIEYVVASREWQTAKILDITKDPLQYNIVAIKIFADLIVPPEETKAYLGVFIDDEPNPRAVITSDLTYPHVFQTEFWTWNLSAGRHTLKIKIKSENGYPAKNTFLEIHITRFLNIKEMFTYALPLTLIGETS